MITPNELAARVKKADDRYGGFASSHEMIGVAYEEWRELCNAVHCNNIQETREECLDLAAVLLRFVHQLDQGDESLVRRSKP